MIIEEAPNEEELLIIIKSKLKNQMIRVPNFRNKLSTYKICIFLFTLKNSFESWWIVSSQLR